MKSSINLLEKKEVIKRGKVFLFIGIGVFTLVFLFSLGFLLYYQFYKSQLSALQQKEASLKNQLSSKTLITKKADLLILKDRLSNIQKIVTSRADPNTKIASILRVIPDNLDIQSINGSDNEISFVLEGDNLVTINDLLEEKIKEFPHTQASGVKKIDLNSFGIDPDKAQYSFSLDFKF